jgi:hypothetical protein
VRAPVGGAHADEPGEGDVRLGEGTLEVLGIVRPNSSTSKRTFWQLQPMRSTWLIPMCIHTELRQLLAGATVAGVTAWTLEDEGKEVPLGPGPIRT